MRTTKDFLGSTGLSRFAGEKSQQLVLRGNDFKSISSSSNSLKNDAAGSSLRSTQQIPLDWSRFENHTFFSSAEVNVNVAFNNIINGFPFDGTRNEIDTFLDELTGYEKWIYDQFPKNRGTLHFSNSKIVVKDIPGSVSTDLSRKNDGKPVLDPGSGNISFQFKAYFEPQQNDNQVILQRLSGSNGYTLAISQSMSSDICNLVFIASSGSAVLSSSCEITKGQWIDIAATLNRKSLYNKLFLYVDGKLATTSSRSHEFYEFNAIGSSLIIGSGSSHSVPSFSFTPKQNLSASLDDFKVFHGNRSNDDVLSSVSSSQYPEENLRLFFKFNEPSGSYSQKSLVLDSSANGLHSNIQGYSDSLRLNPRGVPDFKERTSENPVLFPDHPSLVSLNSLLLLSASKYDEINPNLITKLVPPHYFHEGRIEAGFESDEGPISSTYGSNGEIPRSAKLGSSQILSALLYTWAKQFDETKIFLDHFSKLESYEYSEEGSVANQFLIHQARNMGIELPNLFSSTVPTDEDDGDDFGVSPGSTGGYTLQEIQFKIWRRLVASLPGLFRSKGTTSSVKELIRAFGVNPDTSIRIREYGGARQGEISARRQRRAPSAKLNLTDGAVLASSHLSGSRTEPGIPYPAGSIGALGSNNPSDGLYTSGSWTYEANYKFPDTISWNRESLVRFYSTGTLGESLLFNLLVEKKLNTDDGSANIILHGTTDPLNKNPFSVVLNNKSIFDGEKWHLSFGRERKSDTESMYFLRAGKQSAGQIVSLSEQVLFVTNSSGNDVFSSITSTLNSSGTLFRIGDYSSHNCNSFIDVTSNISASISNFGGEISGIRFYSKYLTGSEWYEHVLNQESLGVKNPLVNFGFSTSESGSFERMRLDVSTDQEVTGTDSLGKIILFDYSQNELHVSGSGFNPNSEVITYDDSFFSSLDPKFDERSSDNKVRIRSWQDYDIAKAMGGEIAPVYEVPRYEEGSDDNRFGIEISIVQGLNEDIIKLFSDYSFFDDVLGDPSSMFESDYSSLDDMRDIYFNRLTGIPEYSNVILFSKWFESTIAKLIEQFLPSNTHFLGVNLVVESHMLERSKFKYNWGDVYLGENNRKGLRGTIGLAQLLANVKRS